MKPISNIFFTLMLCLTLISANGQEAATTTGGNISGSGGSVCYSVGQVVYSTNTGTTGSVAQGVQQPYEISLTPTGLEDLNSDITLSVYPNPITDFLTLQIANYNDENLSYQLLDVNSRLLESKKITSMQTAVSTNNLSAGVYFFKINNNNKEVKAFKIIKN